MKTWHEVQPDEESKKRSDAEWQALREEGKKRGERDAVDGVAKLHATIVENLKIHPQQPYWEGYVEGYEEIREAIKNESKTTD